VHVTVEEGECFSGRKKVGVGKVYHSVPEKVDGR
jgi:hypothetical protein